MKWYNAKDNIKVDDLVLIKEDNLPPAVWSMGRVAEIHTGQDGLVRSAVVKTANSKYTRPIQKLCVLPGIKTLENNEN